MSVIPHWGNSTLEFVYDTQNQYYECDFWSCAYDAYVNVDSIVCELPHDDNCDVSHNNEYVFLIRDNQKGVLPGSMTSIKWNYKTRTGEILHKSHHEVVVEAEEVAGLLIGYFILLGLLVFYIVQRTYKKLKSKSEKNIYSDLNNSQL